MKPFFHRFFAACGLFGLLTALSLGARAELLDDLAAQATVYPLVRAEFTQSKRIAAMKHPLLTFGRMTFLRNQGVLWQIERPYRMTYVLGETRIVEIGEDGTRHVREARDVPGLSQIGRIFQAMLGANPAVLGEHFEITAQGDTRQWFLKLKPRQTQLAQFLSELRLLGGHFVKEIHIDEAGGDITQILLHKSQGASSLTEEEARLFGDSGRSGAF
jgi:hypothetical protein